MKKVLLIDDNESWGHVVRDAFKGTVSIEIALDGVEGCDKARAIKPDLVLLDLRLPRKSAPDVVKELRRDVPDSPIVLCTGDPGALDFLRMPPGWYFGRLYKPVDIAMFNEVFCHYGILKRG